MNSYPIRTCVICKNKYLKTKLIRFTKDKTGKIIQSDLYGRGFYICPNCLSRRKQKIKNRFGIEIDKVMEKLKKDIIQLIQIGWRSRIIKLGFDDTKKAIKNGKKGFLILAKDLSPKSKKNILWNFNGDYYEIFTKRELGEALGKNEVGIIFIPETKFGRKLKDKINQY